MAGGGGRENRGLGGTFSGELISKLFSQPEPEMRVTRRRGRSAHLGKYCDRTARV